MQVLKTLVIGLGSTGTEICEKVAERLLWEWGDLKRVPWVRFLCLETNATTRPEALPYEDFVALSISAADYANLLSNPQVYDPKIRLTDWADLVTLQRIPTGAVNAGAGNIRMVGRLAFLFPQNYTKVYQEMTARLKALRDLSEAAATAALGDATDVMFANMGQPVVFVVGTLCGGTCSGIASDFGFFVKAHRHPGESVIGFFTIPRADLTVALTPKAETYKKNAYSALVELNHYHMPEREDGKDIVFPDGVAAPTQDTPYDILYIACPKQAGNRYNEQLNLAIADYIFLNSIVPVVLPSTKAVDGAIPAADGGKFLVDLGNQAHVFCGFGLSSIEFPVQRVIEACTYRLCSFTLGEWLHRGQIEEEDLNSWIDKDIALNFEGLKTLLFSEDPTSPATDDARKNSREELFQQLDTAQGVALKTIIEKARKLYEAVAVPDSSPTAPGRLYSLAQRNRQAVALAILDRIQKKVWNLMGDYHYGVGAVQQFLKAVDERITALESEAASDFAAQVANAKKKVDELLVDPVLQRRGCASRLFPFRPKQAASIPIKLLKDKLQEELVSREDALLARALLNTRDKHGDIVEAGILSIVRKEVQLYRQRAAELDTRIAKLRISFKKRADSLAQEKPNLSGIALFEPEVGGEGTVQQEYQRCLQQRAGMVGKSWEQQRRTEAEDIIRTVLNKLAEDVLLPSTTPIERDWLLQPIEMDNELSWIPRKLRKELLEQARKPFEPLRFVDVLERWNTTKKPATPQGVAQEALHQAGLFLDLDEAAATVGGRPPVLKRSVMLVPKSTHRDAFLPHVTKDGFSEAVVEDCPDPYRVVFIQDYFRFPLRGVQSIVGVGGIAFAQSSEFPTFFTRKDVFWLGVTEEENRRLRYAEDLLATALMLEIVIPKGGTIQYKVAPAGFGDEGIRYLPLSIRRAAVVLSREESDLRGFSLRGHMEILQAQIQHKRREFAPQRGDRAFISFLNQQLLKGVGADIPDWDKDWLAERLLRYCGRDHDLLLAFDMEFPPDPVKIESMKCKKGEIRPGNKQPAPEDGIYCPECGGKIGATEEEAAQNGWRCFTNPEHYFGQYIRK